MLYSLAKPLLFTLDAEAAHKLALKALSFTPAGSVLTFDPILGSKVAGLNFPNPVGLAPGFDKNAEIIQTTANLGFGFAEIGTVTPQPQSGNDRPRLFRLVEDQAVINRMGFNNDGQDIVLQRLQKVRAAGRHPIIGVNIGANKVSTAEGRANDDYAAGVKKMSGVADYLTVNISSPNTPGLRALQDKSALGDLLASVMEARGADTTPIFLKVAPDLQPADVDNIVAAAHQHKLDALIISNTTIERPATLRSALAQESGGLSGAPLRDAALQRLKDFVAAGSGTIPLIGVGGIASGADAYARIRAGASLVQIYSAMIYEGPYLASAINRELKRLLQRDGFATLSDAIGADAIGQ